MIDREKVKKGLDLCLTGEASVCEDCPYDTECKEARGIGPSPLRMDALELLKEQEPKRVVITTNSYGTKFYHCPRCSRDIYAYPRQYYCSRCGQAVKWDE